ncbi:MAG: M20/M25/M40 family metallo-hydrolase [Dehalococcoidia bacterium]|nr:M20/M25/M40 family metallo-hydrolase [Dehalococcoidia bacterium]
MRLDDVFLYLDGHFEEAIGDVVRLCRQPSISAQNVGMEETAKLVAAMLEEAGAKARLMPLPGGGPPVVYGELAGNSPTTLMLYNHYDVQPPEPLELWSSPPFEPTREGDILRARGVSDDKGDIAARLAAIKAFRAVRGSLPVSLKFCIEGAEEIGSPHLMEFAEKNKSLLKADCCIWEGGDVNWKGQPVIILGVKGILYVQLEAQSASRDVHSSKGATVPNAAWRLVWALASLKDSEENILIPGFRDTIRPLSPAELGAARDMPSEEEELKQSLGVKRFVRDVHGVDFRMRHLFEPTCTICGLVSGYTGPGAKTVLPSIAKAKIDFRLVPDQRPDDILAKLRSHLDKNGFQDIKIAQSVEGENPARTPLDSPFVSLVGDAARDVYKMEPVVVPTSAGTGPMFAFTDVLGLPVASSGVSYPDSRVHAPDENMRLSDFDKAIKHMAAIIERLGRQPGV